MQDSPSDGQFPGNRLIDAVGAEDRARLGPFLERVRVPARQTLSAAGEPIEFAYFPVDAVTSTLADLPEGEIVEVGLMGAEGVVGLALLYGLKIASTTVMVQVPGDAYRIRTGDFMREVVEANTSFYKLLLRYADVFLAMVAQHAGCNASHSVEQRFARWLLLIHDRVRRNTFPVTHEFAAIMLGVRRASVTQVANTLRQAGAVDYRTGHMQILDRDALAASACGCYVLIRELSESIFDGRP